MSVESAIQSALAALAAGGCFPLTAPDPVAAPYIIYSVISEVSENGLDGYTGQSRRRVQIDAYATEYGAAKTLAESIKSAMAGATTFVSLHLSSQDLHESDVQLYRISMDFSVMNKP